MFPISLSGTNAKRLRLGAPRRAASLHLASNLAPGCVSLLGISTTDVPRHVGRGRFAMPGRKPYDHWSADMPPAWSRKSHEAPGVPLGGAHASRPPDGQWS